MPLPWKDLESQPCEHGYHTHSPYNRCPWCFGWDAHNKGAIPVVGPGNGWLLKKGQVTCLGCGGNAGAGYGLLPDAPTRAEAEAIRDADIRRNRLCYGCGLSGLQVPLEVLRADKGQGPMRFRTIRNGDGEAYVQCKGCWRWGRERWAHSCNGHNWSKTIQELNAPETALGPPAGFAPRYPLLPLELFKPPRNERF